MVCRLFSDVDYLAKLYVVSRKCVPRFVALDVIKHAEDDVLTLQRSRSQRSRFIRL